MYFSYYSIMYTRFIFSSYSPDKPEDQRLCKDGVKEHISHKIITKRGGCFALCVWLPQLLYMTITCLCIEKI